jgi:hypothetical protein
MNLNDPKHPWTRLVVAARTVKDDRDVGAPYGFATRVSALAFASGYPASVVERFALRALGVAFLLALLSVAVNYSALTPSHSVLSEEELVEEGPLSLLVTID